MCLRERHRGLDPEHVRLGRLDQLVVQQLVVQQLVELIQLVEWDGRRR